MNDNRDNQSQQHRQREKVVAKAVRNRDQTRQRLLAQGRKLARRRAANVDHGRDDTDDKTDSTNTGPHSTVPSMDSNAQAAARHSHSTVPSRPKRSTVAPATRLYGLRLHARTRPDPETDDTAPNSPRDGGDGT